MDYGRVFRQARPRLRAGGGIAVIANGTPLWQQASQWSRALRGALEEWFGTTMTAMCGTDRDTQRVYAQALTAAAVFTTPATQPAWKTKPSWYAVAKSDRIINPDLERMYAKRARSHTIEVEGASHSIYESHPKEVAELIEEAASHAMEGE